ncbi:MAG: hypothetical protein J6M10_00360 [Clostridia bacterium]|nr:hypothetical protein [Clostridia bacterium]
MRGTEAVDLIRDQMAKTKDEYIGMMGEVMTEYLRLHPETEIDKDKTLQGAFDHLKAEAKKKQKGGCYAMPPKEIFAGMMLYYGLTPEDGDAMRCFAAAMGQTAPDPVDVPVHTAPGKEGQKGRLAASAPAAPTRTRDTKWGGRQSAEDPFDLDALLGGL